MGKAALLLVAAAALAGGGLFLSLQLAARDTEARQNEHRADVLAREAARSVHALVLDHVLDPERASFRPALGLPPHFAYEGGRAEVTYLPNLMTNVADFTVRVALGGALHEIRSQYTWWTSHTGSLPSPVMVQAPWTTFTLATGAAIEGHRPVLVDQHPFTDLGLHDLLSLEAMQRQIREALAGSASALHPDGGLGEGCSAGPVCFVDDLDGFLGRHRAPTLFELYAGILASADEHPTRYVAYEGDVRLTQRNARFGNAATPAIVHVAGHATIARGAAVRGYGVLLVEGSLVVEPGAALEWDGLVMVVARQDHAVVRLDGRTTIRGAFAALQEGAPPGGHMDVTIWRDLTGLWPTPHGRDFDTRFLPLGLRAHTHTHRFDRITGGQDIVFLEHGRGRHETRTRFERLVRDLGRRPVYLEIANPSRHGLAQFEVGLRGEPTAHRGGVRVGWGTFADEARSPYQSRTFPAADLRHLALHVRSLRLLFQGFDDHRCPAYPICISDVPHRLGALSLRVRDAATDALLYEASVYWHRNREGHPENLEELQAERLWRERITAGEAFGLHVTMGDEARITYDPEALAPALGLAGFGTPPRPVHLATWTRHFSPTDVAAGRPEQAGDLAAEPTEVICLFGHTRAVARGTLDTHLAQGATRGPCP